MESNLARISYQVRESIIVSENHYVNADSKSTEVLVKYQLELKQSPSYDLKLNSHNGMVPVIVIDHKARLSSERLKMVLKGHMSEKGSGLSDRCCESFGISEQDVNICFGNKNGSIAVQSCRNCFTKEEAKGGVYFKARHRGNFSGWNKGCEAEPRPRASTILGQLKKSKAMKGCGLTASIVKAVTSIGPNINAKRVATAVRFSYQSAKGKQDTRPFGPHLDQATWEGKSLAVLFQACPGAKAKAYYNKMKKLYLELTPAHLKSQGYPDDDIITIMTDIEHNLGTSTLFIPSTRQLGIHIDAPIPAPAGVCGPANFCLYAKGSWIRKQIGGNLFFADGMFRLDYDYEPLDFILT